MALDGAGNDCIRPASHAGTTGTTETDAIVPKLAQPWLLDTFCKAGGATRGYQQAGFRVIGVDIEPQPNYVGEEFIQADALDVLADRAFLSRFTAIHASPVCKRYSAATPMRYREEHPDQIAPVRERLMAQPAPWVIENVPGAPLRPDLKLCGCMFGLPNLKRERWFETSWRAFDMRQPCNHKPGDVVSVCGTGGGTGHTRKATVADWRRSMGIDWMTMGELSQAIPPAYTEHAGRQLLAGLVVAA